MLLNVLFKKNIAIMVDERFIFDTKKNQLESSLRGINTFLSLINEDTQSSLNLVQLIQVQQAHFDFINNIKGGKALHEKFKEANLLGLTLCYPKANASHHLLLSNWIAVLFLIDDFVDTPSISLKNINIFFSSMHQHMSVDPKCRTVEVSDFPYYSEFLVVYQAIVNEIGIDTIFHTQFFQSFNAYLHSIRLEKEFEEDVKPMDIERLSRIRVESSGANHTQIIHALLKGINVYELEKRIPLLLSLRESVSLHVSMVNDFVSYRKEKQVYLHSYSGEGAVSYCESHKMTYIHYLSQNALREAPLLSVDQAESLALKELFSMINHQFSNATILVNQIREHALVLEDEICRKHVLLYLCDLQGWLNTGIWSFECGRYFDHGHTYEESLRITYNFLNHVDAIDSK